MDNIYGQDVKLDPAGRAMVAANGELILTEGAETGVQDIRLRLEQPLGQLFYDVEFGSLVYQWIKEESTSANRMAFEAEVERRVQMDPRVRPGTVTCKVTKWSISGLEARCQWQFIGEDHPFNLVIEADSSKREMVIKDVNPRID
jgi:phage baseplate assembly protein W